MQLTFILALVGLARAHFVLEIPTSLGWDDDLQPQGPCGGFNATDRTTVTDVSVAGAPVALITTHDESTFVFNAAKLSDLSHWVPLPMELHQTGEGDFCEPLFPGLKGWVGQYAVLQIVQNSTLGVLYQASTLLCYARAWTLSC